MHLDLFQRQCVSCPSEPPKCTCSAGQSCIQISQSCNSCATFVCQTTSTSSSTTSNGGDVSPGALAGAIIAVILVLLAAVVVLLWYRRRQRARQARDVAVEPKPDVPAPAEAVLNRPDPIEKAPQPTPITPTTPTNTIRIYPSTGESVIDLDPRSHTPSRASGRLPVGNPFDDGHSIRTTTTGGTNVIPIALVSPGSVHPSTPRSESGAFPPSSPARPARPDDLVLESPKAALESLSDPSPHYAQSQRSGASRNSCISNASYSSDFLNDAPMIVTQIPGAVRQVVGKVRAEVIQTSGTTSPTSQLSVESLKLHTVASRPSIRSPLAATSFGPGDIVKEAEEEQLSPRSDPFGDHHAPFDQALTRPNSSETIPPVRPVLVIEDGDANRVKTGLSSAPKSSYGTTMAKLLPPSPIPSNTLQEEQQRALAHAQAQARAQGLDKPRRMSGTSVVSTASTRADSILESFPFVPPSPISSRPVRSPPRSPLGQQFTPAISSQAPRAAPEHAPLPAVPREARITEEASLPPLDPPPSRHVLGMSTGSQLSTASSGLGNFPFQIDNGQMEGSHPPSSFHGRQRASLDTLALMSDLSSYPLGYDRDDQDTPPVHRRS